MKHDYIEPINPASLKDALRYSPIGISVYAWVQNADSTYIKPQGAQDNHWCVLYGYEDGKSWHVFDSYDNTHKKLAWDFGFEMAKRYSIKRRDPQAELSRLQKILQLIAQILSIYQIIDAIKSLQKPATPPEPMQPPATVSNTPTAPSPPPTAQNHILALCEVIKDYEGFGGPGSTINGIHYPNGTPSYRNNNPGNCRYSSVGYDPKYGIVKKSWNGFAIFRDYETGWLYLQNLVREKIKAHPTWTLLDFFADPDDGYAPQKDGNNPRVYKAFVANRLKVDPTYQIKNLL